VAEQFGQSGLPVLTEVEGARDRLLDLGEVAAYLRAVIAQHSHLVLEIVAELSIAKVEQVAGIGVPSH
jgi:hypothetical protein